MDFCALIAISDGPYWVLEFIGIIILNFKSEIFINASKMAFIVAVEFYRNWYQINMGLSYEFYEFFFKIMNLGLVKEN